MLFLKKKQGERRQNIYFWILELLRWGVPMSKQNWVNTLCVHRKKQEVEIRQGCHYCYDKQILKQRNSLVVEKKMCRIIWAQEWNWESSKALLKLKCGGWKENPIFVKSLFCEHDNYLAPSWKRQVWWFICVIPVQRRQKQPYRWDSLATRPSVISLLQANGKPWLKVKVDGC